ncbi:hypothetical protein QBC36DRAFT_289452 [Triangularia setosa]|uniref:RRM domain-containing protein n=1 Tax=Triangularia setosa TaxID=2587417 RepID=A0AAN6WAK2_9PEZI|nr:hypothetical protein QBC36DRAFT_289452 [Podospora setosa]
MSTSPPPVDPPSVWLRAGDAAGGPFYILVSNLPEQTDWSEFRNFIFSSLQKKSEIFVTILGEQRNRGWVRVIGFSQFEYVKKWLARAYFKGRPVKVDDPGYRPGGTGAVQIVSPCKRDLPLIVTAEESLVLNRNPGFPPSAHKYMSDSAAWGYQPSAVPRNARVIMQPGQHGTVNWMAQQQQYQQQPPQQQQQIQAQPSLPQQSAPSIPTSWGANAHVAMYHQHTQAAPQALPQWWPHPQAQHPQQPQHIQQQPQRPASPEAQPAFRAQAAWSQQVQAVPSIPQPYFQPVQPGVAPGMSYWGFPPMAAAFYGSQPPQLVSNEAAQAQAQAEWLYQQQQKQIFYAWMFYAFQQQQQQQV